MSFQDPPRRQRPSRYPALAQYEDSYSSNQDTQAGYGSGSGHAGDDQGFAGLAGGQEQRAPWDEPQQGPWSTGTQRSLRGTGAQRAMQDSGAQRLLRNSGAQRAAWDFQAQQTEWDLPRRTSGAFRAVDDDGYGTPRDNDYGLPGDPRDGGQRRSRGLLAGAVAGFLAAAVALGVANLIAGFVRPQASPIIAVGETFIDHTPQGLKEFAIQKFGENDKNMLLLGMYVTIALIAIVIGMLAWRRVAIGVAGIGLFGLLGAYLAITRPESHITDVIPSVIGGIVGIAAIIWLVRVGTSGSRYRSYGTAWAGGNS